MVTTYYPFYTFTQYDLVIDQQVTCVLHLDHQITDQYPGLPASAFVGEWRDVFFSARSVDEDHPYHDVDADHCRAIGLEHCHTEESDDGNTYFIYFKLVICIERFLAQFGVGLGPGGVIDRVDGPRLPSLFDLLDPPECPCSFCD